MLAYDKNVVEEVEIDIHGLTLLCTAMPHSFSLTNKHSRDVGDLDGEESMLALLGQTSYLNFG